MEMVDALFSDGFSDVFGKIGKAIGLTNDDDFDWVVTYLEIVMKRNFDAGAEDIYETVGKGEAMLLWENGEHFVVMHNLGNHVKFHKYRLDDLEEVIAVTPNALQDLRNLVMGMREDLNKLLEAQPVTIELLEDVMVDDEEKTEDTESLDDPRIMGHDDTAEALRVRRRT